MVFLKILPLLILGLLNILVGLGVLLRDWRKRNNQTFFAFVFAIGGWVLGIAAFMLSKNDSTALFWAKVYYFFPLVIAASFVLFAHSFPNYQRLSRNLLFIIISGFLLLAVPLVLEPKFITSGLANHDWGKEIILDKTHYPFYAIYFLGCAVYALRIMYLKSKTEKGIYAKQAASFFRGFLFTAIFGVYFNLILPWVGNYQLIYFGPLFTSIYMIAVAYSIARHRMFDVRLVIARSVAYLLSLGVLVLSYVLVTYILATQVLREVNNELGLQAVNVLLLIFIALTYPPIERFFSRVTNDLFYRDAYDPQSLLDELNQVLVTNINLKPLLENSAEIISRNLKAEYCTFIMQSTTNAGQRVIGPRQGITDQRVLKQIEAHIGRRQKLYVSDYLENDHQTLRSLLQDNDVAVLGVLFTGINKNHENSGYIVIGPKKSGNPYSIKDTRMLEIILNELVIAVQNALRFEEIENFNLTLQEKVNQATRRLRSTNEKLRVLDETKDDFISMASHQLRTPLTSVKGYLSMVLEGDAGKLTVMQRKLLGQAFISSQRMVFLIADLLNVSRLKTGKFIIEPKPTKLADIVEEEITQLHDTANGRGLELVYHKPEHFPVFMLDETKIRQVIMNFIDNAIYYTPSGGKITIELRETDTVIELKVIDSGIGVPKSEQHHLFNKFYRAGNARKARPDGTGLGLFMAKKVIIAQGGSLIFSSHEGKGSTFGFSFPKSRLLQPENATI